MNVWVEFSSLRSAASFFNSDIIPKIIITTIPLPSFSLHYTWLTPLFLITINSSSEKTINSSTNPSSSLHYQPSLQPITFDLYIIETPSLLIHPTSVLEIVQSHPLKDLHLCPGSLLAILKLDLDSKAVCSILLMVGREILRVNRGKSCIYMALKAFDTMPIWRKSPGCSRMTTTKCRNLDKNSISTIRRRRSDMI